MTIFVVMRVDLPTRMIHVIHAMAAYPTREAANARVSSYQDGRTWEGSAWMVQECTLLPAPTPTALPLLDKLAVEIESALQENCNPPVNEAALTSAINALRHHLQHGVSHDR